MKFIASLVLFLFVGCATSQQVSLTDSASHAKVKSIYLVAHGGRSSDMDLNLKNDLFTRDFKVVSGPDLNKTNIADTIVKFSDQWDWDMTMYIEKLNIQLYDAHSGNLMAAGSWENATMHKFPEPKDVIKGLLDEMFAKLNAKASH